MDPYIESFFSGHGKINLEPANPVPPLYSAR